MIITEAKRSSENNRDFTYRVVKEAIMSLQLEPGQSISELELSRILEISRTPIREVMTKLREEYLVEVIPQVGTYISRINPRLVEEAAFLRVTLEKEILKLSCKSFPEEILIQLRHNIAEQELLLCQKGMENKFHELDKQFHYLIFKGNNKENVWASIIRISTHYNRIRLLSEMSHSFDCAINQHKEIMTIIEKKQIEKVDELVIEHIIEPIKLWENLYKPDSPYANYFDLTHNIVMAVNTK